MAVGLAVVCWGADGAQSVPPSPWLRPRRREPCKQPRNHSSILSLLYAGLGSLEMEKEPGQSRVRERDSNRVPPPSSPAPATSARVVGGLECPRRPPESLEPGWNPSRWLGAERVRQGPGKNLPPSHRLDPGRGWRPPAPRCSLARQLRGGGGGLGPRSSSVPPPPVPSPTGGCLRGKSQFTKPLTPRRLIQREARA